MAAATRKHCTVPRIRSRGWQTDLISSHFILWYELCLPGWSAAVISSTGEYRILSIGPIVLHYIKPGDTAALIDKADPVKMNYTSNEWRHSLALAPLIYKFWAVCVRDSILTEENALRSLKVEEIENVFSHFKPPRRLRDVFMWWAPRPQTALDFI